VTSCCAYNRTREVSIAADVERTENSWARMKGLLGRSSDEFGTGKGLWISPSQGIHTIGMRFPIDAVYLDCEGRIIKAYHRLAPYRVAAVLLRARSVLELPAGTLERTGTEIGDFLEIREVPL
jgi:uncharacterized protein